MIIFKTKTKEKKATNRQTADFSKETNKVNTNPLTVL